MEWIGQGEVRICACLDRQVAAGERIWAGCDLRKSDQPQLLLHRGASLPGWDLSLPSVPRVVPEGMLFTEFLHPEESLFQYRKSGESLDLLCHFQERRKLGFPVRPWSPMTSIERKHPGSGVPPGRLAEEMGCLSVLG